MSRNVQGVGKRNIIGHKIFILVFGQFSSHAKFNCWPTTLEHLNSPIVSPFISYEI